MAAKRARRWRVYYKVAHGWRKAGFTVRGPNKVAAAMRARAHPLYRFGEIVDVMKI